MGHQSARYRSGGTTALTTIDNSLHLGSLTKGTQSATNEIAVGYAAEGKGSNTAVWGNTSITDHYFSGNILIGGVAAGTSAAKVAAFSTGTAPSSSPADMFQMYSADQAAGNACPHFRTELGNVIKLYQQAEITDELTTVTFDAPGTPDYDLTSAVTDTTPFGLATADEFKTMLSVIANLQARVNELEAVLVNTGLLADAD